MLARVLVSLPFRAVQMLACCGLLLGLATPVIAQPTFQDSIPVMLSSQKHTDVNAQGQPTCTITTIGVHRDIKGRGFDGDYTYVGTPVRLYLGPDLPSYVSDPGDIPGERISYWYTAAGRDPCFDFADEGKHLEFVRSTNAWAVYTTSKRPVALWDWEQTEGLTVRFDGTESYVATDQGKRPVQSYEWSHGDNPTSAVTEHTFIQPGEYDVTLTVTDDEGQEDAWKRTIVVSGHLLTVVSKPVPQDPERLYSKSDTIVVETTVTNAGESSVLDVVVPRRGTVAIPDEGTLPPGATHFASATYVRLGSETEPITKAVLDKDESIVFRDSFRVDGLPHYRTASGTLTLPYKTSSYAEYIGSIQGESGIGEPVVVRVECKEGSCGNRWNVGPKSIELAVRTFTAPETAPIQTSRVTAGLIVGPDPLIPVLNGKPTREVAHFARIDGVGRCRAGCIDFEVVATDPDTGDPVPGLNIDLTYPTSPGPGVVTPGGLLCDRGQDTCGTAITLTTDGIGKIEGYIGVPGVITETPVTVAVHVSTTQAETNKDASGSEQIDITIQPNVLYDTAIPINPEQANDLGSAAAIRLGFQRADLLNKLCASVKKAFDSAKSKAFIFAEKVPTEFIETICKNVDSLSLTGLLSAAQSSTQIPQMAWFFESTQLPSVGLAVTTFRPMPAVSSQFVDELSAAIETRLDNQGEMVAGAAPFSLYEVSYLEMDPGFFPIKTRALYFRMWSHRALVNKDYRAETWLLERHDSGLFPTLSNPVPSGNPNISTGPTSSSVSQELPDPVASSTRRLARSVPSGLGVVNDSLVATPDSLYAGAIIVLSREDPERVETVRVMSATGTLATGQTAELASPLLYDHPAGASVRVLASGELLPPELYAVAPVDTVETDGRARLIWATIQPVAEVDVQVARDEAFADIVFSETLSGVEIADGAYDVLMADAGMAIDTPYYWRSRARDRSGESAWNEGSRFVVSSVTTSEDTDGLSPMDLALVLYPNPARDRVRLAVEVPSAGPVDVAVFDLLGRRVALPVDGVLPSGRHELAIRLDGLPAGTYVVRAEAGEEVVTQRLTVVR